MLLQRRRDSTIRDETAVIRGEGRRNGKGGKQAVYF